MADTLLSFKLDNLCLLLSQESARFQGIDDQFYELKSELEWLRSFMKYVDAKKRATVRYILKEIQEIVLDTEDIIETFLLKEELRRRTSGIKKRIAQFAGRIKISIQMEDVTKRIAKYISFIQSLGLGDQQMIVQRSEPSNTLQERLREIRRTFPRDNENDPVGLEESVMKLVGYLVDEYRSQVVSITGMGGVGKTTLAREVFNHERIRSHFTGYGWAYVSQKCSRMYVWQTILKNLQPKCNVLAMSEDQLEVKLSEELKSKKVLIVLDDIWREEDWDTIKPMFPQNKGWKVLLTSRNEGVGLHAYPLCLNFKTDCLTPEESWTLLHRIVFPREEFEVEEEMEQLGKLMIKHCGGLPLAIKVLGGLLADKHTSCEWKRVYENIGSHLVGGTSFSASNITSVYNILYLSFEELPSYLKYCFLYLAHFPENFTIDMEGLSCLWAAEGITRPINYEGATIRDVADGYVEELAKRNMVISKRDDRTSRFEECKLHGMMREVCLLIAGEENFIHIVDERTSRAPSRSSCKSRRLMQQSSSNPYEIPMEIINPNLRSLLRLGQKMNPWIISDDISFEKLQLMRVLDLSYARFEGKKGEKVLSGIGKLILLRYLDLSNTRVYHLPSSMRNLRKLIYLNLLLTSNVYVPNFLKEMPELKYLFLPSDMDAKTKLELGNLVNLEKLINFSTKHSSVKDLKRMTKLRNLSIRIVGEGCTVEDLSSSVSKLRLLNDLSLSLYKCGFGEDSMPILEKLVNLKELYLMDGSFSGKIIVCSSGGFPQLRELGIQGLWKWEEWIVEEGSMPLLHTLTIQMCPGLKKFRAGGFPQLQKLSLELLMKWEEFDVEEGSMPLLHTLTISNCPRLKEFPDGLRFLSSLKYLTVSKIWTERLSQGGQEYYKVQHIPSVCFYDAFPIPPVHDYYPGW